MIQRFQVDQTSGQRRRSSDRRSNDLQIAVQEANVIILLPMTLPALQRSSLRFQDNTSDGSEGFVLPSSLVQHASSILFRGATPI